MKYTQMQSLKVMGYSLLLGSVLAVSVTFASWQGTAWITDGATVSATKIKDNLDHLYDVFTPGYAAWASQGLGAGGAAIYNDSGTYKKLMLVGNRSAGGAREVGIWDNLTVTGTAKASAFLYNSDRRLKKDIRTYSGGLAQILLLKPSTYTWRDSAKPDFGLIAQEVEEVIPSVVAAGTDGYKAVDYTRLITVLIAATQEQQQRIEALENKVKKLTKQNK